MRRPLAQTLLAVLFFAAVTAHAQSARQPDPPPRPLVPADPKVEEPFDAGKVEGDAYSNDFFGFSMKLPKGWAVLGADDNRKIMDTGKAVVGEGASEQKRRAIETSLSRTHFLVSASKYPKGAAGEGFNALLICFAERVPTAVIKTGADYFHAMQYPLQGTSAKIELSRPLRTQRVGGADFTVADVTMTTGPAVAAQRYYIRITKGFALLMGYTYYDESDLKTLDDLIATVKFK